MSRCCFTRSPFLYNVTVWGLRRHNLSELASLSGGGAGAKTWLVFFLEGWLENDFIRAGAPVRRRGRPKNLDVFHGSLYNYFTRTGAPVSKVRCETILSELARRRPEHLELFCFQRFVLKNTELTSLSGGGAGPTMWKTFLSLEGS